MSEKRIVYLDVLRVLATFAIVVIHTCAQDWSTPPITSTSWYTYNILDSICRWGVPVFLMISGALFLSPERKLDIKKLYAKNILRLVTAFLFWAQVYAVNAAMSSQLSFEQIVPMIINGKGHMWFILLIIAIYVSIPILRCVAQNEQTMRYFLVASFVLTIVVQTVLSTIIPLVANPKVLLILNSLKANYNEMGIGTLIGYCFYFILGYYLHSRQQNAHVQTLAYVGAVVGFLLTIILTHYSAAKLGSKYIGFYGNLTINVCLQSIGVFMLVKNIKWRFNAKVTLFLQKLASWCFGTYLVHELLILKLGSIGISVWMYHPILSVPFVSVAVFFTGTVISAILNHIPILRKYIV